eukprot:51054-Rhodomonas_salina.2
MPVFNGSAELANDLAREVHLDLSYYRKSTPCLGLRLFMKRRLLSAVALPPRPLSLLPFSLPPFNDYCADALLCSRAVRLSALLRGRGRCRQRAASVRHAQLRRDLPSRLPQPCLLYTSDAADDM